MKKFLILSLFFMSIGYAQDPSCWPGFRGYGNSQSDAKDLPVVWSDKNNILWRIVLAGYGQSSPVVWKDKVFITSSKGDQKETLVVSAIDLRTGKVIWNKQIQSSTKSKRSKMVAQSAPTPAVDNKALYTFFESGDIIALDHNGNLLWKRNLTQEYGKFQGNHGVASSLAQTEKAIIALIDHQGPSYLLSINKEDGKNNWMVSREPRVSWSSPVISKDKIIISSNGIIEIFESTSGKLIWHLDNIKKNVVPSPSFTEDVIVIGSSAKRWCMAIKRDEKKSVLWKANTASSFASPLIDKECVYFVNRAGILTCVSLQSGGKNWSTRLPASVWASPIAANDKVYLFCTDGTTVVIKSHNKKYQPIANNHIAIGQTKVYGVAAVNRHFIIKTGNEIICIHNKEDKE